MAGARRDWIQVAGVEHLALRSLPSLFIGIFETASWYMSMTSLEFHMQTRLALNFLLSDPLSVGIIGLVSSYQLT